MNSPIVRMVKNSPVSPAVTLINPNKCYSAVKTKAMLRTKYFADRPEGEWPLTIVNLIKEEE